MVRRGTAVIVVGLAIGLTAGGARSAAAQMVGVPVLQNAFLNRGVTFGANLAASSGAKVYGAALAWVPENGKVQLSGGAGVMAPDDGSGHVTWGGRIMLPIHALHSRTLGLGAFVGVGSLSVGGATETRIPIGASVGYRAMLGGRAVSAYMAPFLAYSRLKHDSVSVDESLFRVSFGLDVAIASQVGLTVGYEWGGRAPEGSPGPAGGLLGVGLSYALRKP